MHPTIRFLSLVVTGFSLLPLRVGSTQSAVTNHPVSQLLGTGDLPPQPGGVTSPLDRKVSLEPGSMRLKQALDEVDRQADLRLSYSAKLVPLDRRISIRRSSATAAQVLEEALEGTDLEPVLTSSGQVLLVKKAPRPHAFARVQTGTVVGVVTDSATGRPLPAGQVTIVGTSRSAPTNDAGQYRLGNVPAGEVTLRALRIGYAAASRRVTVPDGREVTADFSLMPTVVELDELVVSATGEEQRKREAGVSVGTIDAGQVDLAPVNTLTQLINGRAAGVSILQSSGILGGGTRLRIRGANSLSLVNEPLLIIDGARADNSPSSLSFFAGSADPSRINDINPDEIERIEVIKGPAASALYGTAAANGVIQITTKQGRAGRARWTAYSEVGGLFEVTDYPANFTQFGDFSPLGLPPGSSPGCDLQFQTAGFCTPDSLVSFNPLKRNSPFQDGVRQKYGVSVGAGNDQTTYFLSGDYEDENGVYRVNTRDALNLRANLSSRVRQNLKLAVSTGYLSSDLRLPDDGPFGGTGLVGGGLFGSFSDAVNGGYQPVAPDDVFKIDAQQNLERFTGSVTGDWTPLSWLSFNGIGGLDFTDRHDQETVPPEVFQQQAGLAEGSRTSNRLEAFTYTANGSASANFTLRPDLASTTTAGIQFQREVLRGTFASGSRLTPGIPSLGGANGQFGVGETNQDVRTIGGFAQQRFAWRDRVFLSGALRGDDNSAFGSAFGITYYPSVNASWVVGEEPWFPRSSWVSDLRLRAGWGRSGLRPGFRDATTFFLPVTVTVGGENVPGFTVGGTGNPDLKPERVEELELGFDMSFWNRRVGAQFSYFDKKSKDALIQRVLTPSLGAATSRFENLGRVQNRGVEGSINAEIVNSRRVQWGLTLSGSALHNELVELGAGVAPITFSIAGTQRHVEGRPLGGYWGARLLGFQDRNADGIISTAACPGPDCEITVSDTAEFLGSSIPTREAAISTTLTLFNRVRIFALADHRGGYKQFNFTEGVRCGIIRNCAAINSRDAPLNEQARAAAAAGFFSGTTGTLAGYIEDAAFWKLREVAVTLMAPDRWARGMGVGGLSLTLSGRNLATLTDYTGFDPEINSVGQPGGQVSTLQADVGTQPPIRSFTARLTVDF